jgi:hypothetical protein
MGRALLTRNVVVERFAAPQLGILEALGSNQSLDTCYIDRELS